MATVEEEIERRVAAVVAEVVSNSVSIVVAALDRHDIMSRDEFGHYMTLAAERVSDPISRQILQGLASGVQPRTKPTLSVVRDNDPD